jgi:prophage regulatory protein
MTLYEKARDNRDEAKSASPQPRSHFHHSWMEQTMTQLLRTAEVSARINTKESTLRYWRHLGEGPPSFKLGKKNVVYPLDELERWIARNQKLSTRGEVA